MKREAFMRRVAARLADLPREGNERPVDARRAPPAAADAGLAARFETELARVGGSVIACASEAELALHVGRFLRESGAHSLAAFGRASFSPAILDGLASGFEITTPEMPGFLGRVTRADVGLSVADLGVAASGSLLFLAAPDRPRSVTLLPRSHVAILRARALVPDLAAACAWLAARGAQASASTFVTGPSRTSDIENDLTLGVHGPAAVTVFLLDD